MSDKIYNIKASSLGKLTFLPGTTFAHLEFNFANGDHVKKDVIFPDLTSAVKDFAKVVMEEPPKHVGEDETLAYEAILIEGLKKNGLNPGIATMKEQMETLYGVTEGEKMSPEEGIHQDRSLIPLVIGHIALRYTNGYIETPDGVLKMTIKFLKNIIGINFGEEGNPHSNTK